MKISDNSIYYILIVVFGIWFFVLNLYTPLMHDDLAYHFYYDSNSAVVRPTSEPITSFWQIFPSMWHHYCSVNGRFTSHFLIQLFCGLWGKMVFNVCNTIIFILLIRYLEKLVFSRNRLLTLFLFFAVIVFLLPFPGQTMLWLTGSINYLWTTVFSLQIISYLLYNKNRNNDLIICFFLFLWGAFVGWMNESVSIGVSGGLFFYLISNRKALTYDKLNLIIGYLLGTALIVFSPGTFNRVTNAEMTMNYNIIQFFTMRLVVLLQLMIKFPIILIGLIIAIYHLYKKIYNSLLVNIFLFSLFFLYLLGMDADRVYYGISVISTILCIRVFCLFIVKKDISFNVLKIFSVVLFLSCLYPSVKAVGKTKDYYSYNNRLEQSIRQASNNCVIEKEDFPDNSKFVYVTYISPDRYTVHNRARAFYYNKSYVHSLSGFLYKQYNKDSFLDGLDSIPLYVHESKTQIESFFLKAHPYLIIPVPDYYVLHSYEQCHVYYKPHNDNLKTYQKVIRWLLGTLNNHEALGNFYFVEKGGCFYYILPFDNSISHYTIPVSSRGGKCHLVLSF